MTKNKRLSPTFRVLLRLLPKHLRAEHEDELRQFLALEIPEGRGQRIVYWFHTLGDILRASPSAHLDILRQDLILAFRQLCRAPGYAVVTVLTLAVGIAGNAALFTVVDQTLLQPLPFVGADHLVRLDENQPERGLLRFGVSPANFRDYSEASSDLIEGAAAWQDRSGTALLGDTPERVTYAAVSGGFFEVFREVPVLGRAMRPEDDVPGSNAVVVSHAFWSTRLGRDREAIGRSFDINGVSHRVIGVMPEGFSYPGGSIDLWTPLSLPEAEWARRGSRFLGVTLRLSPGVAPEQLDQRVRAASDALAAEFPDTNEGWNASIITLQESAFAGVQTPLLIVWSAAGLILLIAVANVANLLLARAVARRGEMTLRRALGARSARLVRQTLTEGAVLATLGGALGLGFAALLLVWFRSTGAEMIPSAGELGLGGRTVAFTVALTGAVTLLFSMAPAAAGRLTQAGASRNAGRAVGSVGRARLQTGLVVGEVALAVVVAVGTGLLARSAARLFDQPLGYQPANVTTFRVEPPIRIDPGLEMPEMIAALTADRARISTSYQALMERIRAEPDVVEAGAVSRLPLTGNWWITGYSLPSSADAADDNAAFIRVVVPGYLAAMGTGLTEGRALSDRDVAGAEIAVVIDQTFAETHWGGASPIGEIITLDGLPGELMVARVVGVAESIRQSSLESAPRPTFYITFAQAVEGHGSNWGMDVVLKTRGPGMNEATLKSLSRDFLPDAAVFRVLQMDDLVSASVAARRFQLALFGGFAALALALTLVGVFGVLALYVRDRSREFSVRLALGATPRDVRWMVQRNALVAVGWGSLIGLGVALLAAGVFESLIYEISVRDPIAFAAGPIALCLVALAGAAVPAWNATRTDPATVLRGD
jgi:putative ABC transport system permease protein